MINSMKMLTLNQNWLYYFLFTHVYPNKRHTGFIFFPMEGDISYRDTPRTFLFICFNSKTILFICFNSKWFNFIPNNYILLRFNCLCLVWDFLWDCSWCFWFGYWKCSGLFYRFILILFLCLCVCFLCSIVFYVYSKLLKGLIVFYFIFAVLFFLYFDCFSLFFCLNVYTVNIYIYRQYMFVFMFQIRFCWFVQSVF